LEGGKRVLTWGLVFAKKKAFWGGKKRFFLDFKLRPVKVESKPKRGKSKSPARWCDPGNTFPNVYGKYSETSYPTLTGEKDKPVYWRKSLKKKINANPSYGGGGGM